jgi:hypothetical protein
MAWQLNARTFFVCAGIGMVAPVGAAGAPFIEGAWGGDRLQLVADAQGVRIETDCASGAISGRIQPAVDGRFDADGQFEQHQGGPQRADTPARPTQAHFSGEVKGSTMALSILPAGAKEPQVFTLRQGVRVKLVRCG